MKNIAILGSTGSIGTSTLDVISCYQDQFEVVGLTAFTDIDRLAEQVKTFHPKIAAIANEDLLADLKQLVGKTDTILVGGEEAVVQVATCESVDAVVSAIVGAAGLLPTLEAIKLGKEIHLANKEVLVMAGELVNELLKEHDTVMLPIDSEHNAIFQCLRGENNSTAEKIILTASGGPFRFFTANDMKEVDLEMALKHPNWNMGPKITIDSATMMNKGLELIEAKWLFNIEESCIEFLIHPESIIHSMVQFQDGSILAQLGISDMRIPIQYALTYPERLKSDIPRLNFAEISQLRFMEPDLDRFPALNVAREVLKKGQTFPTVLNAANEIAVQLFLNQKIHYLDIIKIIEKVLSNHKPIERASLEDILDIDKWARKEASKWI